MLSLHLGQQHKALPVQRDAILPLSLGEEAQESVQCCCSLLRPLKQRVSIRVWDTTELHAPPTLVQA